ncbi:MAG: MBL fold metallo-hydrolase [Propionibacteriaceae bacterium]|nr:MBL fold metallo-hydrolase [Micropruina sp.]HBX80483.1 Zn-dependent hydrolase [Propionibacteriaceae bacterium]HBY23035.1 Zn-dependent hydrolase [Propionibacteriaceae bacterium]
MTASISSLVVGPLENNAYLLEAGGECLLVDAADDAPALLAWLGGRRPAAIVTTHRHRDHWAALAEVAEVTGAQLVAGDPDAAAIALGAGVQTPDGVWDGDVLELGGVTLEVIGLVGHTPGSIALVLAEPGEPVRILTGDSLFPGGPGKVIRPEAFETLMSDLVTKIFDRFPDDTIVLPGHGLPTTLGTERPKVPEWWARRW